MERSDPRHDPFEQLGVSPSIVTHLVQRWEHRVLAIKDRGMRSRLLLEVLEEVTVAELIGCLDLIVDRSRAGLGRSRELLQEIALDPCVIQDLPYDRQEAAYSMAREAGFDDIARMFLSHKPPWQDPKAKEQTDNDYLDLPLGIRRQAARTSDRDVLDRLCHDRNPKVITLLLNNPRIVERDVVRIAAMRPTAPDVLKAVAGHRKWASRYRVRKALVCNPFTPTNITVRLLPTLMKQDLADVMRAGELEADARDRAQKLVGPPRLLDGDKAPTAEE